MWVVTVNLERWDCNKITEIWTKRLNLDFAFEFHSKCFWLALVFDFSILAQKESIQGLPFNSTGMFLTYYSFCQPPQPCLASFHHWSGYQESKPSLHPTNSLQLADIHSCSHFYSLVVMTNLEADMRMTGETTQTPNLQRLRMRNNSWTVGEDLKQELHQ